MKASDYIVSFLAERGIDTVFGYIGGMITHLVDSLGKSDKVRFVQTYHEQTAAIAAEGYAIESGKFGVAICTSGPGVTNMMTGIADAYFGSIPVIFITGQVNSYEYKYDKPIRQQGFQETDVVSIVKPITKYAVMVDNAENLRYELEKAVHIATTGRKGPVVIDLPMNISRAELQPERLHSYVTNDATEKCSSYDIDEIIQIISSAKHPMLLLGGGCVDEKSSELINSFISQSSFPVVTSLMGRGSIDESYSYYVGMIGSYGNRCANIAVSQADVLIALGSRLDTRQTGAMIKEFIPNGKIIHVDIDINELSCHRLNNRVSVNATISEFIEKLLGTEIHYNNYIEWLNWIQLVKSEYNQDCEIERFVSNKAPYKLMQKLNDITKEGDVITADVGQNQMWAAQAIRLKCGMRFVNSGGLAPMGFSLPAAIGIAFANPSKKIFCITGDGGLHMAIQSLLLISQYKLNISVIVLNNSALGMITQFQHLYFDDRMEGTTSDGGYLVPDLKSIADAYNLDYTTEDLGKSGCLFDYRIEGLTTVSPKLEYNQPIYNPSPYLPKDELDGVLNTINMLKQVNIGGGKES
jgi:acetolactate synthase-1/2/3 large subunit